MTADFFNGINSIFVLNSMLLGAGLAMDAFSVSVVNGLGEPKMKPARMMSIAGCYAFFQFAMPMIGWVLVSFLVGTFKFLEIFIPWIGFLLLLFIGGKMVFESARELYAVKRGRKTPEAAAEEIVSEEMPELSKAKASRLSFSVLLMQGVATSIDALSVGFTTAGLGVVAALLSSLIIAAVTFVICMAGLKLGKLAGKNLGLYAGIIGGVILIGIGVEILLKGLLIK